MTSRYPTSAHLAAQIVHAAAASFGDIEEKCVVDLGCGTGMLSAACVLLGASRVVGVDVDQDALDIAARNVSDVDLIAADVRTAPLAAKTFETCVMNPPFGTRRKGIDVDFLRAAFRLATTAVYSLHKSSTRDYLLSRATDLGAKGGATVVAQLKFDVPKLYTFHTRPEVDVAVDLLRFDVDASGGGGTAVPPPPETSHARSTSWTGPAARSPQMMTVLRKAGMDCVLSSHEGSEDAPRFDGKCGLIIARRSTPCRISPLLLLLPPPPAVRRHDGRLELSTRLAERRPVDLMREFLRERTITKSTDFSRTPALA